MNQSNSRKIAVIDVDGTLINGQIQQKLVVFFWKRKHIDFWYFFKINLWFVLYKIGLSKDIKDILEYGLGYVKGKTTSYIDKIVEEFVESELESLIFPKSLELLNELKKEGYTLMILSSAVDIIIDKISKSLGVDDYICTRLEKENGIYTGKIYDKIIYGPKKVESLKDYFYKNNYSLENAVAYADHKSDIPLLKTVGKAFLVNPNKKMRKLAQREGINIIFTR